MLRPDFSEIFDYMTRQCVSYSLNTNGTLITPPLARLMKRKGSKMVSIYGATAEVHDHITRSPGSFETLMQGFAYLKEAGTGFTVQIVPMKDNCHQLNDMIRLAESLSPFWRFGASWLYLSASGDPERNREIAGQRLDPRAVAELDQPDPSPGSSPARQHGSRCRPTGDGDRLFAPCIGGKRDFHIDPYGTMSFCPLVRDPALRRDLREGSFQEGWEVFIPSLVEKVNGGREYRENCSSCELREDCLWCAAYAYLEHRRFSAKVNYLCSLAKENRKFKLSWEQEHRRFYQIAGLTIEVESDLPIRDGTFGPRFQRFETNGPGEDTLALRHRFSLPDLTALELGKEVYRKSPWAIYKRGEAWIYAGISPDPKETDVHVVAVFAHDHSRATIYHGETDREMFMKGDLRSLTLFPTDQIVLARVLADRGGCYLHSAGVILDHKGVLFVGHSEAGKSTLATLMKGKAEILCDDRIIVRDWPEGFRVYGTWSHGDVTEVSPNSAPLKAILFLEKAGGNQIVPLGDRKERFKRLLGCVVKPFVTAGWWEKTLSLVEKISSTVPCYVLRFDKSAVVSDSIKDLVSGRS
jgi:MoaA/NifB/PqqE/SkfB family radical SAM enzyme